MLPTVEWQIPPPAIDVYASESRVLTGAPAENTPLVEMLHGDVMLGAYGARLSLEPPVLDHTVQKVLDESSLMLLGKMWVSKLFHAVVQIAPDSDWVVMPTEDEGVTLEFSAEKTGRDLLFAIPQDGSVRYFTARGPGGFRKSGIIRNVATGEIELARWLVDSGAEFPTVYLDLG